MPLEGLAMSGAVAALAAHGGPDDDGDFDLLIVDVGEFAGLIDKLVGGEHDKIAEHDFYDGAKAGERQPVAETNNGGFADWSIQDAAREFSAQSFGDFECSAVRVFEVFTEQNDFVVVREKVSEAGAKAFDDAWGVGWGDEWGPGRPPLPGPLLQRRTG